MMMISQARCRMAQGARKSSAIPCRAVPIAMCSSTSKPWATKKRALATHRISTCQDPSNSDDPSINHHLKRDWPVNSRAACLSVGSMPLFASGGKCFSAWPQLLFWINRCQLNLELSVLVHRLRSASRLHLLLGSSDRRRRGIETRID